MPVCRAEFLPGDDLFGLLLNSNADFFIERLVSIRHVCQMPRRCPNAFGKCAALYRVKIKQVFSKFHPHTIHQLVLLRVFPWFKKKIEKSYTNWFKRHQTVYDSVIAADHCSDRQQKSRQKR